MVGVWRRVFKTVSDACSSWCVVALAKKLWHSGRVPEI